MRKAETKEEKKPDYYRMNGDEMAARRDEMRKSVANVLEVTKARSEANKTKRAIADFERHTNRMPAFSSRVNSNKDSEAKYLSNLNKYGQKGNKIKDLLGSPETKERHDGAAILTGRARDEAKGLAPRSHAQQIKGKPLHHGNVSKSISNVLEVVEKGKEGNLRRAETDLAKKKSRTEAASQKSLASMQSFKDNANAEHKETQARIKRDKAQAKLKGATEGQVKNYGKKKLATSAHKVSFARDIANEDGSRGMNTSIRNMIDSPKHHANVAKAVENVLEVAGQLDD